MKVAVLGLGAMGTRMAANLAASGFELAVWNRTPHTDGPWAGRGARVATSPADAAAGADVVITIVRDDEASREVWLGTDGALAALRDDAVGVESSTVSVDWVSELSDAFAARPAAFLDAPVLGSRAQAEAATLIHVVGGRPEALDRARPVLSAVGGTIHHMGPAGSGAAMKLLVNALLGIQVAALAELLGAAQGLGLDRARVAEVYGETAVASPAGRAAAGTMLSGDLSPAFPVELLEKDLGYLVGSSGDAPITAAAQAVVRRAIDHGLGAGNMTAVARLYETRT